MAIKHRQTLGNVHLLEVDAVPNGVTTAPVGSYAFLDTGASGPWVNTDGATAWSAATRKPAFADVANAASPYAVPAGDHVLRADTTAGDVQFNLPAVATSAGVLLRFKKIIAANNMILQANGAETIDGANTQTYAVQWSAVDVYCNGTTWDILG